MRDLPSLADDGLLTPVVGDWAEDKYRLFGCYADIFATSMKSRWQHRVCVDLYAGAGRARIRGSNRIIPAPPMLALDVKYPFTRYIFSDYDAEKLDTLKRRVTQSHPSADAHFVLGDTNANIENIANLIPSSSSLTFCFADPYRLADLKFSTITTLAETRRVDFLVLVPSGMDANRNRKRYLAGKSEMLDQFLGNSSWPDRWREARKGQQKFPEFVVDELGRSMARLDYKYEGISSAHPMISTKRKLLIYHLMMLSKHPLGGDFWEKCRAASASQRNLF